MSRTAQHTSRRMWGAAVAAALLLLLLLFGVLSINIENADRVGGRREIAASSTSVAASAGSGYAAAAAAPHHAAQRVGLQAIAGTLPQRESDLVAGEALFFDPSPLFLPTRWNAGGGGLPDAILQQAEELFEDYAPRLRFPREGVGGAILGQAASAEARASALLFSEEGSREATTLSALGRRTVKPARLPVRSGRVEVLATAAPLAPLAPQPRVLALDVSEPVPSAESWRPLELAAVLDAAGLVGAVTLVRSSDVEAVDEFFRDYVARLLDASPRLAPGVYRIVVGP